MPSREIGSTTTTTTRTGAARFTTGPRERPPRARTYDDVPGRKHRQRCITAARSETLHTRTRRRRRRRRYFFLLTPLRRWRIAISLWTCVEPPPPFLYTMERRLEKPEEKNKELSPLRPCHKTFSFEAARKAIPRYQVSNLDRWDTG